MPSENSFLVSIFPLVPNIDVIDGRLYFDDKKEFDDVIQILFNNQKNLDGFETQFPGFISSRQAFNEIKENGLGNITNPTAYEDYAIMIDYDGEKILEPVIYLNLLSPLFNSEGIIQIGDEIFKFTYDYTLKADFSSLKSTGLINLTKDALGVTAYKNVREIFGETDLKESVAETIVYYTSKKFLKAELNRNITYLFNALTVDSKSRKKNFLGIGFAYRVYWLHCWAYGAYNWYPPDPGHPGDFDFTVDDEGYNSTDVQETIITSGGIGVPQPYFVWAWGVHHLQETSSSSIIQCNTSY